METIYYTYDHKYTLEEKDKLNKELLGLIFDKADTEQRKADISKRLGNEIKGLEEQIVKIAEQLKAGSERRSGNCPVQNNWVDGIRTVFDPDSREIICTETIPEDQRQMPLPYRTNEEEAKAELAEPKDKPEPDINRVCGEPAIPEAEIVEENNG